MPNIAERLGFDTNDKLLLIHADDFGMCHSVNAATREALDVGIVTCAAVMIPCPWMKEAAQYARERPDADIGVHLTLTAEWEHYRWGPVSPDVEVSSLLDDEGFFPRSTQEAVERGQPDEVEREIRAQIDRARQFGFLPTHIDSHMGTLFHRNFYSIYSRVGKEMGLMPMLISPTGRFEEMARGMGIDPDTHIQELERQGFLFLDSLLPWVNADTLESRREAYYQVLREMPPGVHEMILHLSMDDLEIRSITGHWAARWHEFQIFTDPKTRELIDSLGIRLIGYRDLARLAFQ